MRTVKITGGKHKGVVGFFHGFFACGSNEEGIEPCALIELPDGTCVEYASNYICFESQPAEIQGDGQAFCTTQAAQNAEDSTSGDPAERLVP